jgi:hypothetical protein
MNRAMVRILRTFLLDYVSYYLFKFRLGDRTFKPTLRETVLVSRGGSSGSDSDSLASRKSLLTTCKQVVGIAFEKGLCVTFSTRKTHPRVTSAKVHFIDLGIFVHCQK